MVVISVSIIESSEQIVAGFPRTITLTANVPSTIFYTTDGSTPTNFSSVFTSPIIVPTDVLEFTLKTFATNGVDTSPVITAIYTTNILNNARIPHSTVSDLGTGNAPFSQYPFGSNSPAPMFDYLNNANAGTTVDNPLLPEITFGYDANGNPISANQPFDDYLNIYSTTDWENRSLPGVGNLPAQVKVIGRRSPPDYSVEESSRASPLFDARAMVIFQDAETDDPTNPVQINPQMFSLENLEITEDGAPLYASGLDSLGISGSFLKTHYNPRTQQLISYYRDSRTNRWIISSSPYQPKNPDVGNLSNFVFGKHDQGVGRVIPWNLFLYRTLT